MTLIPNIVANPNCKAPLRALRSHLIFLASLVLQSRGMVIATYGVSVAFIINGISYLAFIFAVSIVKLTKADNQPPPKSVWTEMLDGVRYTTLTQPVIRSLLIVIAVASVFGRGALEMMPAFADKILQRGASGLALLTSALGVGAISTGLVLAGSTRWLNARVIKLSVMVSGLLIVCLGLAESLWLVLPIVVCLASYCRYVASGSQILIQTMVEDSVRGRVSSFWSMIAFGGLQSAVWSSARPPVSSDCKRLFSRQVRFALQSHC